MGIDISSNKCRNRFDVKGITDPVAKGKSGIAGYHGRCGRIIGWIAAKIFRKAVPIQTKKGVIYLNCKSLDKWRLRVAPDSAATNIHDPKAVLAMIEAIKNRNTIQKNIQQPQPHEEEVSQLEKSESKPQARIEAAPKSISLNFTIEDGIPLAKATDEEKSALSILVNVWKNRKLQENWTIGELATLVKQEESALQKLFGLVHLFPNSQNRYSEPGVDKFFSALELGLEGGMRLSCQPSVKILWNGNNQSICKIFGAGVKNENWKLDELSQFLAVSQSALVNFFGEQKDQYSYEEINRALKNAENRQINEILEKNRTQKGSIRWAMVS